jgi:flagellar biosynthetic protein FliQ
MTPEHSIALVSEGVSTVITMVAILVVPSMLVGLVVSIFQTATSIQEQTLSFLPRLVATLLTLIFTGGWMLERISALFHQIFISIPGSIG